MSYYRDDTVKTVTITIAVVAVIALIVVFICMPIKGYMDVESYHWNWTIDLLEYRQVHESGSVSGHYTRSGAENAARSRIPDDAYNIDVETHSYTKKHIIMKIRMVIDIQRQKYDIKQNTRIPLIVV